MEAVRPDLTSGGFSWGGASIIIRPVIHWDRSGFWFTNFEVQPELRQRGIGSAFMRLIVAEADETNVDLWLDVLPSQPYLVRLYTSLGFVPEPDPFPSPADELGAVQLWRPPVPG